MGIQTMASQVGGGGQQSQFRTLGMQSSPCALMLSEVQIQLGEPLQSMNLDEFLRNVQPPEENRQFTIDLEGSSSRAEGGGSVLLREGSVILPKALSRKTVDEVWRDIQQAKGKCGSRQRTAQEKHPALGEMTLEDFLAKVGVVAEESGSNPTDQNGDLVAPVDSSMLDSRRGTAGVGWLRPFDSMPSSQQQQQQQEVEHSRVAAYAPSHVVPQPVGAGMSNVFDSSYPDNQANMPLLNAQIRGRKRMAPEEMVEKTVERRQKRMIKNRESAARSRARKQAYTNELENKVARLEEENERLKKQKKLDKLLHLAPPPQPKSQLRRTLSASF